MSSDLRRARYVDPRVYPSEGVWSDARATRSDSVWFWQPWCQSCVSLHQGRDGVAWCRRWQAEVVPHGSCGAHVGRDESTKTKER